jgi:peptidoglycan/LPS O-acetylase OafA/YrhL
MFLFNAGMGNWRAGWCVGPRYIACLAPFLLLPIVQLWPRFGRRRWFTAGLVGLAIPSVLINVVSGALYPHYPEAFDNPLFDLAFPLLAGGYTPYGLGWLLGLRGLSALAPLGLLVLAALALVAAGDDPRPGRAMAHVALALAVAGAFLVPLSAYGRAPRPAEQRATATVHSLWDPESGAPRPETRHRP